MWSSCPKQELSEIIAMINFDVTGSGITLMGWGHPDLTGPAAAIAVTGGIPFDELPPRTMFGSDHVPFHDANIPVIILRADDVSRINSPRDTRGFCRLATDCLGGGHRYRSSGSPRGNPSELDAIIETMPVL